MRGPRLEVTRYIPVYWKGQWLRCEMHMCAAVNVIFPKCSISGVKMINSVGGKHVLCDAHYVMNSDMFIYCIFIIMIVS